MPSVSSGPEDHYAPDRSTTNRPRAWPAEQRRKRVGELAKRDRSRGSGECGRLEVTGEAPPHLEARRGRAHHRIDPEQFHATQDER